MATFTKTPAGSWKAEIRLKGWPRVNKTFRTKRDAQDWARAKEDEMVQGSFITRDKSENTTIKSAFDRYVKEVVPTKKESSRRRDIGRAKFLSERLGQYSMSTLNSEIISGFRDKRLHEGKSNNTVRLELALLSHLYTVAIKEWGIGMTVNPVLNVRKPSPGKGRERRLKKDEEERLLRAAKQQPNPYVSWIIRLALSTAMRKGEIVSLVKDSVDMDKKTIFIRDTKNSLVRTVPMSGSAYQTMKEVMAYKARPEGTNLLFPGKAGKDGKHKHYIINKAWTTTLGLAEIEDFRFHDLRHEATSRLVEAGFSDQQVASITGHSSMQMLKRYTHLRSEDLVSMMEKM
jgi:integrase